MLPSSLAPISFGLLLSAITACSSQSARQRSPRPKWQVWRQSRRQGGRDREGTDRGRGRQRLAKLRKGASPPCSGKTGSGGGSPRRAQRLAREEAERAERSQTAIAAARAQRTEKLDRIAALEQQIAEIQAEIESDSEQALVMQQAIAAAEELLAALTAEIAKYELADESGNTLEPLSKDLIAELEARKDKLVDQARAVSLADEQ